jgi:two-component system response regulator VanR
MAEPILFVDDESDWRQVTEMYLKDSGYEVMTAKDGTDAMSQTEGLSLGLIILDLNLAGEDGLMLMKFLLHNHPGVPVILYTGQEHSDEEVRQMLRQGAQRYVRKGRLAELLEAVQSVLK